MCRLPIPHYSGGHLTPNTIIKMVSLDLVLTKLFKNYLVWKGKEERVEELQSRIWNKPINGFIDKQTDLFVFCFRLNIFGNLSIRGFMNSFSISIKVRPIGSHKNLLSTNKRAAKCLSALIQFRRYKSVLHLVYTKHSITPITV